MEFLLYTLVLVIFILLYIFLQFALKHMHDYLEQVPHRKKFMDTFVLFWFFVFISNVVAINHKKL